jgi:hypothetical protein
MEDLIFNIDRMEDNRIRVVISDHNLNQKGVLYFEKVKVGFVRKPISLNSWTCVDSKIEGLYDVSDDFSSLDILNKCQEIIRNYIFNI